MLYDQVERELKQQYELQIKQERDKFRAETEKLRLQGEELEKARAAQQETIEKAIKDRLQQEKRTLTEKISAAMREEQAEQLKALQEELQVKSAKFVAIG